MWPQRQQEQHEANAALRALQQLLQPPQQQQPPPQQQQLQTQQQLAQTTEMPPQAVTVRGVRGPAGEFGAHGVVDISHNASRVYAFMARVEDMPRWNSGVKASQVLGRSSNTLTVRQVLNWSFMALRGDFSVQLCVTEQPEALAIRTEMTHGSMMRRFSSCVGVSPTGPGSCRLEMSLFMQPNICVPFGIRSMVGGQVRRQLAGMLQQVQQQLDAEAEQQQQQQAGGFGKHATWGGLRGLDLSSSGLGGLAGLGALSALGAKCDLSLLHNALRAQPVVW